MQVATVIILSVIVGFLTCSDANLRADSSQEKPSQVVRQFVSFAHAGEFDKVKSLVISSLTERPTNKTSPNTITETQKGGANSRTTGATKVIPDEDVFADETYEWVVDFAKSIHDEKLSIKSIRSESIKDTE